MNIINAVYESNRKLTLDSNYAGTQADHNSTEIRFTIPVELDGFSMRISWDVYIEDLDGNFGQPIETVLNKSYLIPNAILHATSNGVVRFQILFVNDEDEIVEASELTKLRVSPATPGVSLPSLNVGYINFYRLLDKAITGVYWDELNLTFDTIKGDTQTVTVPWEKVSGDMENNIDLWNYLVKIATSLPYNPDQMTDAKFVRWSNGKAITKDIEVNDVKTLFDKLATINSRIDGLNGAYVIVGRINSTYPTAVELNDRVMELKEEPPRVGWVLIDSLNNEWYWNNGWDNLGQFLVADATSTSAGILKLHNSTSTATDGTWTARLIKSEMDKRATLNAEGTLVQNLNSPWIWGRTLTALFNGVTNNSFATITTRDNDIGSPFGTSGLGVNLQITKLDALTGTIIAQSHGDKPRIALITCIAGAWSDWRHVIHTDTWKNNVVPVTGSTKGLMEYSETTKAEMNNLSGVTSNIQTQLNDKESHAEAVDRLNSANTYADGKVAINQLDVPANRNKFVQTDGTSKINVLSSLSVDDIPVLPATKITSGTLDDGRLSANVVKATVQTLTTGQKAQARTNIGAVDTVGVDGQIESKFISNLTRSVNIVPHYMFRDSVNIETFTPKPLAIGYCGFARSNVKTIDLTECKVFLANSFLGCTNLTGKLELNPTVMSYSVFNGCTGIESIDINTTFYIANAAFSGCSKLTMAIFRSPTIMGMQGINVLAYTPIADGTGFIYVPDALVNDYKTATNWVTYASQIKGISELP